MILYACRGALGAGHPEAAPRIHVLRPWGSTSGGAPPGVTPGAYLALRGQAVRGLGFGIALLRIVG